MDEAQRLWFKYRPDTVARFAEILNSYGYQQLQTGDRVFSLEYEKEGERVGILQRKFILSDYDIASIMSHPTPTRFIYLSEFLNEKSTVREHIWGVAAILALANTLIYLESYDRVLIHPTNATPPSEDFYFSFAPAYEKRGGLWKKQCTVCTRWKSVDEFSINSRQHPHKRTGSCRECRAIKEKRRRKAARRNKIP